MSFHPPLAPALGAALFTSAVASADVITQQIDYAWNVANGNETLYVDVNQFDDLGGTRVLDGVTISIDADYTVGFLAENLESVPIDEGQWFVEAGVFMNLWIEGEFESTVTGFGLGVFSADLAANDGVPGQGPDSVAWDYAGHTEGSYAVPEPGIGQFVGDGTIATGIYPFLSLAISAPPPLFDLFIEDHQNIGTMTVDYEYHVVPAPGALAMLGLAGTALIGRRRRR